MVEFIKKIFWVENITLKITSAVVIGTCVTIFLTLSSTSSSASEESSVVKKQIWVFNGILGYFNKPALRRGYEVYTQVCTSCHGMKFLHYRDLKDLGYSREQIVALAALNEIDDGPNDEGEYYKRPALPSDSFVSPFTNDSAARFANNGALPPDLSLIVARKAAEGGADFIYALMTEYSEIPEGVILQDGLYYNRAFKGRAIAMSPPLSKDIVAFSDGTEATIEQMALDVAQFLAWASDPSLEQRKHIGLRVIIFLIVLLIVVILYKRRVWAQVH